VSIKIYIVRHGQPLGDEIKQNIPNSPLGEMGKKQAILAASEVERLGCIDYIYSSTYNRALDTAKAFYEWFNVPWHVWPALSETGRLNWPSLREMQKRGEKLASDYYKNGDMEEVYKRSQNFPSDHFPLLSELEKQYCNISLSQPFEWPDEWWLPLIDETRELAYMRARRVIEAIKQRHNNADCSIALVCHAAFGSVLMTVLTEGPPCDYNRFSFAHAAFSCVKLHEEGYAQVLFSNYIAHLFPKYLTAY